MATQPTARQWEARYLAAMKKAHKREETVGNGHRLMTSCSCGWSTHVESWRHDKRQRLTEAFRAHQEEAIKNP